MLYSIILCLYYGPIPTSSSEFYRRLDAQCEWDWEAPGHSHPLTLMLLTLQAEFLLICIWRSCPLTGVGRKSHSAYETSLSRWAGSSEQASQIKLCLKRAQGVSRLDKWADSDKGSPGKGVCTWRHLSSPWWSSSVLFVAGSKSLAQSLASSKHSVHIFKWINSKNSLLPLLNILRSF